MNSLPKQTDSLVEHVEQIDRHPFTLVARAFAIAGHTLGSWNGPKRRESQSAL